MRIDLHRVGFALLASLSAACSSPVDTPVNPTPILPPALTGAAPFVVSDAATGVTASIGNSDPDQAAYISLPPGTLPGATGVSIRVQRTGAVVSATLVDGGLDPVAVPAVAGDTISLTVEQTAGAATSYLFTIPLRAPPIIVRTDPTKHKRDVPLNAFLMVVFSEPIDSASLTVQDFHLRSGSGPVAGRISFANAGHTAVAFVPATELTGATDYELVLDTGIRDLEGTPLDAAASIPFTTVTPEPPPAATQMAFVRDSEIFVAHLDGSAVTGVVQLTHSAPDASNRDPAWSPDGRRLAFASNRGGSWGIYVMDADGSNVVQRFSGAFEGEPAWAPDGRTIAFSSLQGGSVGVYSVDADTGQESRPLLNRRGYNGEPAWSPDGRKVAFSSDWRAFDILYDLYVASADGAVVTPLVLGPFFYSDGTAYYFQPGWSPDGQKLAVVVCTWAWDNCYPNSAIAVVNADGSGLRTLAQAGGYARPTWSPDGRMIAFSSSSCRECSTSLHFVRADGTAEGLIVANGHSPAWRP